MKAIENNKEKLFKFLDIFINVIQIYNKNFFSFGLFSIFKDYFFFKFSKEFDEMIENLPEKLKFLIKLFKEYHPNNKLILETTFSNKFENIKAVLNNSQENFKKKKNFVEIFLSIFYDHSDYLEENIKILRNIDLNDKNNEKLLLNFLNNNKKIIKKDDFLSIFTLIDKPSIDLCKFFPKFFNFDDISLKFFLNLNRSLINSCKEFGDIFNEIFKKITIKVLKKESENILMENFLLKIKPICKEKSSSRNLLEKLKENFKIDQFPFSKSNLNIFSEKLKEILNNSEGDQEFFSIKKENEKFSKFFEEFLFLHFHEIIKTLEKKENQNKFSLVIWIRGVTIILNSFPSVLMVYEERINELNEKIIENIHHFFSEGLNFILIFFETNLIMNPFKAKTEIMGKIIKKLTKKIYENSENLIQFKIFVEIFSIFVEIYIKKEVFFEDQNDEGFLVIKKILDIIQEKIIKEKNKNCLNLMENFGFLIKVSNFLAKSKFKKLSRKEINFGMNYIFFYEKKNMSKKVLNEGYENFSNS